MKAILSMWCSTTSSGDRSRRRKVLVGPIQDRLKDIVEQVVEENAWNVLKLAIQPDHVHLFLRANPYMLPTDIARTIKGRSSHLLREEFEHLKRIPSFWTRSTFDLTVGNLSSDIIERSSAQQSQL